MQYNGDIGLYLSGEQVVVPMSGLFITQPTVRQIVQFGEKQFFSAIHLLVNIDEAIKDIKEGNSELSKYSDFQILLEVIRTNQSEDVNNTLDTLFHLITPNFIIKYKKTCIEFHQEEDGQDMIKGVITDFNFSDFQTILSELFISKNEIEGDFNPANKAAKEIADKLRQARNRNSKQKKEKQISSILGTYASILSIGLQIDINIFYNYKPFQLYDAFNRYLNKVQFDMFQQIRLVPFADTSKLEDKEPDNWMRDLYI